MMHLLPKFSSKIQICDTQEYASDLWNVVDFVTNSLYVATIGLRVRAFCDVSFTHSVSAFRYVEVFNRN